MFYFSILGYPRVRAYNFNKDMVAQILGSDYERFEALPGEAKKYLMAAGLYDAIQSEKKRLGVERDSNGIRRLGTDVQVPGGIPLFGTPENPAPQVVSAGDPGRPVENLFKTGILSPARQDQIQRREKAFNEYLSGVGSGRKELEATVNSIRNGVIADQIVKDNHREIDMILSSKTPESLRASIDAAIQRREGKHGTHVVSFDPEKSNATAERYKISESPLIQRLADNIPQSKAGGSPACAVDGRASWLSKLKGGADNAIIYPETIPHLAVHENSHAVDMHSGRVTTKLRKQKAAGEAVPADEFRANRMLRSYLHRYKGKVPEKDIREAASAADISDNSYGAHYLMENIRNHPAIRLGEVIPPVYDAWAANQRSGDPGVRKPAPEPKRQWNPYLVGAAAGTGLGAGLGAYLAARNGVNGTGGGRTAWGALAGAGLGALGGSLAAALGKKAYGRFRGFSRSRTVPVNFDGEQKPASGWFDRAPDPKVYTYLEYYPDAIKDQRRNKQFQDPSPDSPFSLGDIQRRRRENIENSARNFVTRGHALRRSRLDNLRATRVAIDLGGLGLGAVLGGGLGERIAGGKYSPWFQGGGALLGALGADYIGRSMEREAASLPMYRWFKKAAKTFEPGSYRR